MRFPDGSGKVRAVRGETVAKKVTKGQKAMTKVMREFKAGTLNTGKPGPGKGPKVKSRKQAIAIGLSEKAKASRGGRKKKKG